MRTLSQRHTARGVLPATDCCLRAVVIARGDTNGGPKLPAHGMIASAEEGWDAQAMFERVKEQLEAPTVGWGTRGVVGV